MPALPKFTGLDTSTVTIMTPKNMRPLAINIASRNIQLTILKSNFAKERKIRDGRANVPTNVAMPFDSVDVTTFRRPAMYLKRGSFYNTHPEKIGTLSKDKIAIASRVKLTRIVLW